jgi:hypothetical protein
MLPSLAAHNDRGSGAVLRADSPLSGLVDLLLYPSPDEDATVELVLDRARVVLRDLG